MNISVTFFDGTVAETHWITFPFLPVVGQKIFLKGNWYILDELHWDIVNYYAKPYATARRIENYDSHS